MGVTLAELANRCQAELRGDPDWIVERASTLEEAGPRDVTFVAGEKYLRLLAATRAGVVILGARDAGRYAGNVLISANPRLCFTRVAVILYPQTPPAPGAHSTAVIDPGSIIDPSATIGPHAVIEAGANVGSHAVIGSGCFIGRNAVVGSGTVLHTNAVIAHDCMLGRNCIIHPGVVIGSDGFGYASDGPRWEKTPQVGRVVIGDDVEIGANTTIDRGALGDTQIERGVKLDNLIQIGHNVFLGEDTAVAACAAIAGSARLGKRCKIAGQVGIVGHIEIADDVHITGATVVSHTIREPGMYSSGTPLDTYQNWLKNAVRMRQLDDMARRIRKLEHTISTLSGGGNIE
jgi:UDP-3-O-[3-hydroxymyristoyl] glucosamine N-acyltransferase